MASIDYGILDISQCPCIFSLLNFTPLTRRQRQFIEHNQKTKLSANMNKLKIKIDIFGNMSQTDSQSFKNVTEIKHIKKLSLTV